mgnify:CR=1 FL=1
MSPHGVIAQALGAQGQPLPAFRAAERAFAEAVGHRLFTIMALHRAAGAGERVYSSNPEAYPVAGRKPLPDNRWTEQVVVGMRPFLATSLEEIAGVFPDHRLIASLGCGSVINTPVIHGGQVVGTVNLLDAPGRYRADQLAICQELGQYLITGLLNA